MAHITVQIGPCCTIPFGVLLPEDPVEMPQPVACSPRVPDAAVPRWTERSAIRRTRTVRVLRSRTRAK